MKRCKVCRKKPRLERRVNADGVLFCSDDCYDEYDYSPDDFAHPYIDDYKAMRREYADWMENYEEDLFKSVYFGYPKKSDLLEWLDGISEKFDDYYRLAGTDGAFSAEIYHYLLAFEELRHRIGKWELDERKYGKWLKTSKAKKEYIC